MFHSMGSELTRHREREASMGLTAAQPTVPLLTGLVLLQKLSCLRDAEVTAIVIQVNIQILFYGKRTC